MANVNGGQVSVTVLGGSLNPVVFSGTVKLSAAGVKRQIIGCNVLSPDVLHYTTSDASGNWSLTMNAGSKDMFRIIAIGIDGENTEIFDRISI